MKVLVCGGAGYIGSHMVQLLGEVGHEVVIFDNLSTGHHDSVLSGTLIVGDLLNEKDLDQLFAVHGPFDLVIHFCAKSLVGESVQHPSRYYRNNVTGTHNLLEAMRRNGSNRLVFSSSAAVYGVPNTRAIDESHPCVPINPYGKSKLIVEQMLQDYHSAYGMRSVSFRYFNAAGAHPAVAIGERHDPETHLIPNILMPLLSKGSPLKVFGDDYDTPDGSCVRDYIHVCDLCDAHLAATMFMEEHDGAHIMNLGNGEGFSVFEIIEAVQNVTGKHIDYTVEKRRAGDPPVLVANSSLARRALKWSPAIGEINRMIETAWNFHQRHAASKELKSE